MVDRRRLVAGALVVALGLVLVPPPATAKGDEDPDARAVERLDAMTKLLSKAKGLQVKIDCSWDVLQPGGEKIEFGETRVVTIRRPNRFRVDVVQRNGNRRGLLYDGKEIAAFDLNQKVYATTPEEGSVDDAFDHLTDKLQARMPLHELFSTDLPKVLAPFRESTDWVARETVGDVSTDHVWLRGDDVDLQVWIASEGDPLPRRIVITYRSAESQPQFRADLTDWNLSGNASDDLFVFTPAGAEKIPFVVPQPGGAAEGPR